MNKRKLASMRHHKERVWIGKHRKKKVNCSQFINAMQKIHKTNFNQGRYHASWYYKLKEKYDIFEDETIH